MPTSRARRARLLRGRDGRYADLVRWASRGHVERAIEAAAESPVCFVYFRLMAGDGEAGGDVRLFDCVVSRLPGGTPGEIVGVDTFPARPRAGRSRSLRARASVARPTERIRRA